MRILIVCSGNKLNFNFEKHQAFIFDQVEALKQVDSALQFDYFFIKGKGLTGYLSCLNALKKQLDSQVYHCIHAHIAVSGLLANLQRKVPVVTTFHGSDIVQPVLRGVSSLVDWLSRRTIYITQPLVEKAIFTDHRKRAVVPCGVDFELFRPRPKQLSRRQLGLLPHKRYVLFSSNFTTVVKNYPLAKSAIGLLQDDSVELLELKNYTRQEVAVLMTAVDAALMTSLWEGSPQFVKEALACNCPVISTDVGDVRTVIQNIQGCHIITNNPVDVADKLRRVLSNPSPIGAREHIHQFDSRLIAQKIHAVYRQIR